MAAPQSFAPVANRWKKSITTFVITLLMAIALVVGTGWQPLANPLLSHAAVSSNPPSDPPSGSPADSQRNMGLEEINAVDDIPFWIWVVLPRLFPEKLPGAGGYTALGLTWERGSELPIGFTKQTNGIPKVVFNDPASADFDVQRYQEFLVACAKDPRFNANFILPEITYNINLSLWTKLVYRFTAIPNAKKALLSNGQARP